MIKFSTSALDMQRFDVVWRAIQRASLGPDTSTTFEIRATYDKPPNPNYQANGGVAGVRNSLNGQNAPVFNPGVSPSTVNARAEGPPVWA